jgi:copper chaperone CopZ
MTTKTLKINNIGCNGCVSTITNELNTLAGVHVVTGSVADKTVTVEYDAPDKLAKIMASLQEIEYPAEPVSA